MEARNGRAAYGIRVLPHLLSGSDPTPRGCRLSDPNIHSCLAMPDQVLRNPRHEKFAQELATGKTADGPTSWPDIAKTEAMLLG